MREQTFQCLLKPHSFILSWRDKKESPGGAQPEVPTGLQIELLRTCKPFTIIYKRFTSVSAASRGTPLDFRKTFW